MTFARAGLYNVLIVVSRLTTSIAINKIFAIYLGPGGYAIIGQVQNILGIASSLAGGVLSSGILKYTAEFNDKPDLQRCLWSVALKITIISSIVVALLISISYRYLYELIGYKDLSGIYIVALTISLPFSVFSSSLISVINGKKDINTYFKISVSVTIINLLVNAFLIPAFGLMGALYGLIINPIVSLFVGFLFQRKIKILSLSLFTLNFDPVLRKKLFKFGMMGVASAITGPLSLIFVREYLINEFGLNFAGCWQAVTKISDIYLMVVVGMLTTYFLPRYAELKNVKDLRFLIRKGYVTLLPLAIFCSMSLFASRNIVIDVLFSSDFSSISKFIGYQLVGDIMKIGSWIVSFVMTARGMVKNYVLSEIFFAINYCGLLVIFTKLFGQSGAYTAYAVNYAFYWAYVAIVVDKHIDRNRTYSIA